MFISKKRLKRIEKRLNNAFDLIEDNKKHLNYFSFCDVKVTERLNKIEKHLKDLIEDLYERKE